MDDVARAAGVSRLIVYRIFDSKQELYRAVLLTRAHRDRRAVRRDVPSRRSAPPGRRSWWCRWPGLTPTPSACCVRHAWREPLFADLALEFRGYVTGYARAILANYITDDELLLDWAARTAGAHMVEGLCNWLDVGDPARDDEFGDLMTRGLRGLAAGVDELTAPLTWRARRRSGRPARR